MRGRVSDYERFALLAITPAGLSDISIAVAASRAGALGVLDLEYVRDEQSALSAIGRLSKYPGNNYGVKIASDPEPLASSVISHLPEQIKTVILTPTNVSGLLRDVQTLRARKPNDLTILLETTSLPEAQIARDAGVDGLIAKGHEAGGRVGEETTLILLQRLLAQTSLPVWAHGGIGLHTAAACYVAGAAGVILDAQLALTRESPIPEATKNSIARMDGSETICVGNKPGETYRIYYRPGLSAVQELRELADSLSQLPSATMLAQWREAIRSRIGWGSPETQIWPVGQDAAFARPLAERFRTVGGVLEGLRESIDGHVCTVRAVRPLDQGAPLARSHGTRYPIVQGPMTRVSDTAAFAAEVAKGGALPFLALALLREPEVRSLLEDTRQTLGDRPWGVGILGFVPLDLRQEQLRVVKECRPSFALIAGGRPDQALTLEQVGIPTYLHVPSPGLLKLFIDNGARRFVFEGRECGGHVGPRSSFVLWNTMIDTLLESLPAADIADCHVLFAGGIHNDLSASMVAALAAPLAESGAKVGVLLGTAYLFTKEAVASGAIVEGFQQEAIRCVRTSLLESGPGHATRCVETPYVTVFEREKQRLSAAGTSAEETRSALEELNLGRLRIASKGISRHPRYGREPQAPRYVALSQEEQRLGGMYMIGQVASLRDSTCTIQELHEEVSVKGSERLASWADPALSRSSLRRNEGPCDVAIVGMACLLPKAPDIQTYWRNILDKVDAISEIPKDRWDWQRYFDSDPRKRDKVYSKWGGFLEDIAFDPLLYGIPPSALPSIEPLQILTLEVVRAALDDAGYAHRPFPRQRTSVIIGAGGGLADLGNRYAIRSSLPMFLEDVSPDVLSQLPEWTEDSFAGILLNVAAGRVANRFDLGGVNYTVDAACASSLAAVYLATRELESGTSDMVIVGGADTVQNPFAYLCFSKTRALSPRGQCRTFDESADGIVISEGVAVLVLKRLADAERDGDRIYAVVKAVAGSSDGRAKGLTAPRPEGQVLALERAYAKAGFSPASVGLIEAHGTGTVAGDEAEVETLKRVFRAAGAVKQSCAIGSVKSMIGHTKCTAGVAGLIKVALALHDRVLPPTANVEKPNRKAGFPESPFYINTEARPWIQAEQPRRAGVSAFGFGGTNFHAVVEEYTGNFLDSACQVASQCRSSELLLWAGNSRQEILSAIEPLEQALARGAKPALRDLAYTLWQLVKERSNLRLSVVATSLDDLKQKLVWSRQALTGPSGGTIHDPRGIYFTQEPLAGDGKIACLFPGQGSQYPGMLRDLSIYFPEVREQFELADRVLADRLLEPLSTYVFPPPSFSPEEQVAREQALTQTSIAQPALGAAGLGLFRLLQALGLRPDMVAGHSYGEYVALCSADVFSEEVLYRLSEARGRCIIEAAGEDLGTMAAVTEGWERIDDLLKPIDGVWIANANSPRQTVISGTRQGVGQAIQLLEAHSIQVRPIPVACAFHSPVVAGARDKLAAVLSRLAFGAPQLEVFSNSTASPYPAKPEAIGALLAEHLVKPVRFASQVEAMYRAGARIFVEAGPRNILTSLVDQVLGDRDHLAVALDGASRAGLLQLHHALGQLATHGALLKLDRFYQGGFERQLNLEALEGETGGNSPATWLVNGGGARPIREARAPNEPVDSSSPKEGTGHAKPQPLPDVTVASTPSPVPAINGNTTTSPPAMGETEQPARRSAPSLKTTASVQTHVIPGALNQSAPSAEAGSVILQFQRLMNRFLETQQQVMLAYLQKNGDKPALSLPQLSSATASNISTVPNLRPTDIETVLAPSMAPIEQALPVPLLAASAATALDRGTPDEPLSVKEVQHSAGKEPMTRKLLQIVSERTGYPTEMLDLDLNLEADLGIDSIKRVEILGAFQRVWAPADQQMAGEVMEKLTGMKTLRSIVDSISANLLPNPADRPGKPTLETQSEPASQEVFATSEAAVQVPRFLLTAVDAPTPNESLEGVKNPVLVVTDDERGVAKSLIEKLRRQGARAVLVRMDYQDGEVEPDLYRANLADPSAVGKMLDRIRERHGSIAGLIHLLPLKTGTPFEEMDLVCWQDRLRLEVKSLFHLSQAAGPDLKRAVDGEEGWLIAATSMGGAFGIDATKELPFPSQGGVAGLIKTLALEWPSLCSKVVDFVSTDHPSKLAEHLVAEMGARDQEVEVGYRGSRRLVLRATPAPAQQDSPARLGMDANEVVLITGGARGITAEIASELASRYRPTLLLVGRSPLPDPTESALTSGLNSPRDLKAALIDQMRQAGQCVTPAHVEIACSRLLQDREIRANLSTMRQAGATVQYYSVDVRDEHAFGHLIEEIYRLYGRLDGVIHGAGVIEDKLIEDKVPDSFDRVLETKVISAFVLSRKLRPESLKFLVFFSSVAGRFGNRGQSDYAAANEVLNKLAICLDQQWQARVTSINWGPWEKTGMVSREVQRQFAERGVQMITPQAGRRAMDRELRYGKKGEVEVILGAGPWGAVEINRPMSSRLACPLLDGLPLSVGLGGSIEAIYGLDPSKHLYLQDHQLDAKPVLPAAMAMELMAETVQKGWPEWQVVGVRALRVLRGIVLDDGRTSVRVMAKPQTQPSQERLELDVDVEVIELGPDHACYRATVQLAERLPEPPAYKLPSPSGMREFPMTVEDAYRYWLFHGPRLQCISRIDGVDAQGIVATVVPSSPRHCLISSSADQWLIDPIVIDSGPQLAILWARAFKDMTALPSKLQSYRRYGSLSGSSLRCYFQVLPDSTDHTLHASVFFTSSDGHLLGLLEGLESTCSRALNRLTGFSSKAAKGLL